jgi:prepilin-type N-terminal cleavage/methylation domain-containing protein
MRQRRNRDENGFTILEVMIAMAILAMGFLAVASAQIYALQRTAKSKHLTRALHLAQEQMEAFNSMPLINLPATGNDPTNPIDPDPNDNDVTTFLRTWVVEPNTPSSRELGGRARDRPEHRTPEPEGVLTMRTRSTDGFTIIELLVAMAMLAVVSSQLFLVFQTQQKAYITNEHILDVQADARLIMDLLIQETRMAGFMVPEVTAASSTDGGAGGADIFCVSDANEIADAQLTNRSQPFDGAQVSAGPAKTVNRVDVFAGELDIDGDGANDFAAGQAVILAEAGISVCKMITSISNGDTRINVDSDWGVDFSTNARAVPAVMYQVQAGGLGMTRNGTLLSAEVEDLQVEFGVDVNGDGLIVAADGEFPIDDLAGFNVSRTRQIRVTVTTRTSQGDPDFTGGYDAAANRAAGAADTFRRRRFVASIKPRNLGNP